MKTSLVLTLIGSDKPGLVELVSATLAEHQANWEQSSMTRLAGKFAGILIASIDSQQTESLLKALEQLETQGLKVIAELDTSTDEALAKNGHSLRLELIGLDKPGIVKEISHALATRNISVEHLETEVVSGSMSAEMLFKAAADLLVPVDTDLDELQDGLEAIASDLMVEIKID